MPVIVVTGPSLTTDQVAAMLRRVTSGVAGALALQAHDVHAMFVEAKAAATGERQVAAWPTAILHGSARATAEMGEAARVLGDVLADAWHTERDEVWVQWQIRS